MRIEDILQITRTSISHGCMPPERYVSIDYTKIKKVLTELRKNNVPINDDECEKAFAYPIGNNRKVADVPINLDIFPNGRIISYTLRGAGLTIKLEDVHNSSPRGGPGVIGGDSNVTTGIVAKLTYESQNGTGVVEAARIVETAKKVIRDLYRPKSTVPGFLAVIGGVDDDDDIGPD